MSDPADMWAPMAALMRDVAARKARKDGARAYRDMDPPGYPPDLPPELQDAWSDGWMEAARADGWPC